MLGSGLGSVSRAQSNSSLLDSSSYMHMKEDDGMHDPRRRPSQVQANSMVYIIDTQLCRALTRTRNVPEEVGHT